jgi:hypothetical protein
MHCGALGLLRKQLVLQSAVLLACLESCRWRAFWRAYRDQTAVRLSLIPYAVLLTLLRFWVVFRPPPPRSRNCGFFSGLKALTPVAYLLTLLSLLLCVLLSTLSLSCLTPMPMPHNIFPNAFSEPETRRGGVLSASLLHLRSRLPPCLAVLLRVPSVEAQCARAWRRVGVPVTAVGLPLPPALVPPTGPEPPCVNTGALSSSAPASCCSGSSPEFRNRGPSVLNGRGQKRHCHRVPPRGDPRCQARGLQLQLDAQGWGSGVGGEIAYLALTPPVSHPLCGVPLRLRLRTQWLSATARAQWLPSESPQRSSVNCKFY